MRAVADVPIVDYPKSYRGLLWGGLIAGALDISAAFVNSGLQGRGPILVLQSIASGLLGSDSYRQGFVSAALGLAVHFLIAFIAATVYYLLSRRFPVLIKKPLIMGPLYGIGVYLFMYLVVLRLVFPGRIPYSFGIVVTALLIHMVCVGLSIALCVSRCSE